MNGKRKMITTASALFFAGLICQAQTPVQPASMTASLNKKLGMYVFPAKQQDAATQAKDEQEAYAWAVQQSGVDPLNMQATAPAAVNKGPDGSVVKGAARGALAGVAIGAIAGDAGKGAAIGATGGGIAGGVGKRRANAGAEQQAKVDATQKDTQSLDGFKKAYAACLEGKGYSVK